MVVKFGYWNIRGLGQSIRYVMEYGGFPYEEKTYLLTPEKHFSRDEWLSEKFSLGFDFPNLPYLILDNGTKITQSLAIIRYVARQTDLFPKNDESVVRAEMLEQEANSLMWKNIELCYDPTYSDSKKNEYIATFLETSICNLDAFLGDRQYFTGDKVSYVDFLVYEMLDQHCTLFPEYDRLYKQYPRVENFLKRIESLPKFKEFLDSDRFLRWPVWSESSIHGGPKMKPLTPPVKY